ncbi:WD40 repeat domain-containing protein [Hymenobacter daeguensis]
MNHEATFAVAFMSEIFRPPVTRIATLAGHRDAVYALTGGAGSTIYSGSADGMVVGWDAAEPGRDGELLARVENSVYALRHLPGLNLLVLGHNFQGIQAIDLAKRQLAHATALPPVAIFEIVASESRQRLYVALGDGTLAVLRLPDFRLEKLLRLADKSLRCLAVHEGRGELAVGSSDTFTRILDLDSLAVKYTLGESTNSVFSVAYSPDGARLLTAGRDAQIRTWDVAAGYALAGRVPAHLYTINHLAFSPDGHYLASCSLDKSIKLWDAATLTLLRVLDRARAAGHGTSVNRLVWPGNQNRLVSCSDDRSLAVWQLRMENEE